MCTNCIKCKSKNCVIKQGKQKQEVKDIFIETIQKIIDSSPKAKQYYSDELKGYFSLNYHGGKYKSLNNKSQTYDIDVKGVNSDFKKIYTIFTTKI